MMKVQTHCCIPALLVLYASYSQAELENTQPRQLALEEVFVTAQKRQQSLQDVPVSVSAVTGEQIIERGIVNLEEMSTYVPNLTINQSPGATKTYIRGLGSGENLGFEQSVGLFIDGMYAGRARQYRAPFLDVASVEVLRGPQGTLFGKNTIAGAIIIDTERPTREFDAILRTSYDIEYGDYAVDGIVSGPLTDNLSARLAIRHDDDSGYFENTFQSQDDVDTQETVYRLGLLWDITDNATAFLKYENGDTDLQGKNYSNDEVGAWEPLLREVDPRFTSDGYHRSTDLDESEKTDSDSVTLNVDVALGDFELTSISAYSEYRWQEYGDADTTALDAGVVAITEDFDQWSQELRLTSPTGGAIDYIIGAYYHKNNLKVNRGLGVTTANVVGGPDIDPIFGVLPPLSFQTDFTQDSESYALFGSLTWHPTERLHINVGLRYTKESKDAERTVFYTDYLNRTPLDEAFDPITDAGINSASRFAWEALGVYEHDILGDRDVDDWSPTVRISYDVTDNIMLYASASTAFKSGGFNDAGTRGDEEGEFAPNGLPASFEYDDEEALSYEVGGKMRLLDERATLNFAVFRTEFDNLQVSAFQGDSFIVGNAADVTSQGVELDGVVLLSEAWTLSVAMAYLDAEYGNFPNASCTVDQSNAFEEAGGAMGSCQQDLSGRELPFAPEWSGVVSLDYRESWGEFLVTGTAEADYTGKQYLAGDLDPHTQEDANTRINGRVAIADLDQHWEVALVGKNLTDETVRTFVSDPFLLDNVYFSYLAPPRTFELQLNLRW
ncbi:MAG: TonB-dependent receptor [Pseudomonadota bacterium]